MRCFLTPLHDLIVTDTLEESKITIHAIEGIITLDFSTSYYVLTQFTIHDHLSSV